MSVAYADDNSDFEQIVASIKRVLKTATDGQANLIAKQLYRDGMRSTGVAEDLSQWGKETEARVLAGDNPLHNRFTIAEQARTSVQRHLTEAARKSAANHYPLPGEHEKIDALLDELAGITRLVYSESENTPRENVED